MSIIRRIQTGLLVMVVFSLPLLSSFTPQESRVNQKRIEKEREKKQKQAKKQYDKAVSRHKKMQSKETKARMKQTSRESKSVTPLNR